MRKIITPFILLLFVLSVSNLFSQQCLRYRYHKLLNLGRDLENATHYYCTGTNLGTLRTNLMGLKLNVNEVYYADLGYGSTYYKVDLALDKCSDPGDEIDDTSNIIPVTLSCSNLTWKYHKLIHLGSSFTEANYKVCNDDITGIQYKLNIYTRSPLKKGEVYHLDIGDGNGPQYYYIKLRSYTKGDPDYEILGSSFDNTTISFSCDQDTDGDGILDSQDGCPYEAGPASNNGCPLPMGDPDFIITEITINGNGTGSSSFGFEKNRSNNICVTIKNQGEISGRPSSTALIISNRDDYLTSSIISNLPYPSTNSDIGSNESKRFCISQYLGDTYLGYSLSDYNYIHAIADYYNEENESNENNNHSYAYLSTSRKTYPLLIQDLYNNKKITVRNKEEEEKELKKLNKGLYILKSLKYYKKLMVTD